MSKKMGKCKFYNNASGYGFITNTETGEDVFVHATGLIDQINENDQVTFEVTEGKKGPNAINVEISR